MPTRSQKVGRGDPQSGQNATDSSNEANICMLTKQNARIKTIIDMLLLRVTEGNGAITTSFDKKRENIIAKTLINLERGNLDVWMTAFRRILHSQNTVCLMTEANLEGVTSEMREKAEASLPFIIMVSLLQEIQARLPTVL